MGVCLGFPPIGGGLDTLHHAPSGIIEGKRGAQFLAIAEQRHADARNRERRSMDAPPCRHRFPAVPGMGAQVGVSAGPGPSSLVGAPVYV